MSDFIIKNPLCPQCGLVAKGTADMVPGIALLNIDLATGEAEYAGETKMYWDGQTTDTDDQGRPTLICDEGHEWPMEEEEETDEP